MTRFASDVAFTPAVKRLQSEKSSRTAYPASVVAPALEKLWREIEDLRGRLARYERNEA